MTERGLSRELVGALHEIARVKRLLVALDFDGTLAPEVDDPELARAIPEARAAGLPIVATRVDGIPESLDGGAAGLLVPPHAPDALANAIAGLLLDPAQRERLRAAASRNLERLTVHRMACETMSVYGRAMAERTGGAR